jgi:hypothetical protein
LAIHTTASARVAASALLSARSASSRDCGGCGNTALEVAVNISTNNARKEKS